MNDGGDGGTGCFVKPSALIKITPLAASLHPSDVLHTAKKFALFRPSTHREQRERDGGAEEQ
jgi:hypothetical protein